MSVDTLYKHCLKSVANTIEKSGSSAYETQCFRDLARIVIRDLLFYVTPHWLLKSRKLLQDNEINTDKIWLVHYKKRWSYKHQIVPQIFKYVTEEESVISYFDKYMEKHFHELLRSQSFPNSSQSAQFHKGLLYMLTSVHDHMIGKVKTDVDLLPYHCIDLKEIDTSIQSVQNLSILASQCEMLFSHKYLTYFERNIVRMDLHLTHKKNLPGVKKLVLHLLHNGCLKELNLFHSRLDMHSLRELLHALAGHIKPTVILQSPHLTETNGKYNASASNHLDKDCADETNKKQSGWDSLQPTSAFSLNNEEMEALYKSKGISLEDLNGDYDDEDWSVSEDELITDESEGSDDDLFDDALKGVDDQYDHDIDMQGISMYRSKDIYSCVNPWEIYAVDDSVNELQCPCQVNKEDDQNAVTENVNNKNFHCGLQAFSMIGGEVELLQNDLRLADIFTDVIPMWPSLKCIAFAGCPMRDLFLPGTIASQTDEGFIKEIVIEDMRFTDGSILEFISDILTTEEGDIRKTPMKRLRIINIHKDMYACKEDIEVFPPSFNGFVEFELRGGNLVEKGLEYITTLISRDQSLRTLALCGLNARKKAMKKIMHSIQVTGLLESLDLSESHFDGLVEKDLCEAITNLPHLRKLFLKSTTLSPGFVTSDQFHSAIMQHKKLYEIDLSDNRFGKEAGDFLCKILCGEKLPVLKVVSIAYTGCSGEHLYNSGKSVLEHNARLPFHCLKKLDISGNKLGKEAKNVVKIWGHIVDDVVCKSDDFTVPFAEHISQM